MTFLIGVVAAIVLGERLWKEWMVVRFFRRPIPVMRHEPELVSILQPVVSGDPLLAVGLARNLQAQSTYAREFLWLGDEHDPECQRICESVQARYPHHDVRYIALPPPPQGFNPKMFKLATCASMARGDIICVLDDDTELPDYGLERCLPALDQPGVGLAFGLPYYVSFTNLWSSMTAAFVDSNSLLTYIPYTALTAPFTINGMFYAMRRTTLAKIGGFMGLERILADDFAIAQRVRERGFTLAQTPLLHAIRTQVTGPRHYMNLIRRWFVAPRESIMRHISWRESLIFYSLGLVPALFPLLTLALLILWPSPWTLGLVLVYFGMSFAIFAWNNARYLHQALPWGKAWLVPVMQIIFPLQLLMALLSPQRVNWRGNVMQIERGGTFRYVQRRGNASG